jgi:hypothetical protein
LPQTIAAIVFALLIGASMTYGTIDGMGTAVLFLVLCIFHNVYFETVSYENSVSNRGK